jgi:protein ImuB
LWGGEPGLLQAMARFMGQWGAPVRLGLADTAGAAWALARYGEAIAPPGGQAALLADLPVEALRLTPDTAASLRRLGLKIIGQAAALPRAEVARRFEPELLRRLDQALGRAEEALTFRRAPTPWIERRAFFEPLSALDDFARVTGDLAEALCRRLAAAGRGGRRFEAVFHRVDGRAFSLRIGTALPNRTPGRLVKLLAPKLESVDPGFGVEVVTLAAHRVEPLAEQQDRLTADQADESEEVAALVDRLSNRLGEARVWRAAPEESHAPERAVARASPAASVTEAWDPERPRPLRLLRHPELIEAMAPVPDDPPVVFTWRGVRRRVRRAEGPERIAQEWWRDAAAEPDTDRVRDYYAVEDVDGARFWLFRAGLYAQGQPTRWYLHGLFG